MNKKTSAGITVFIAAILFLCLSASAVYAESWGDHLKKADAFIFRNDESSAASEISKAYNLALDSGDWQGVYQAATYMARINRNDDAVSAMLKAADLAEKGKDVKGLLQIADFLKTRFRKSEALSCLKSAESLAKSRRNVKNLHSVVNSYLVFGETAMAKSTAGEAKSLLSNSSDWKLLIDQANIDFKLDRRSDALESLERAEKAAITQRNGSALKTIASLYDKAGNGAKANDLRVKANGMGGNKPSGHVNQPSSGRPVEKKKRWEGNYNKGFAYIEQGMTDRGRRELSAAMNIARDDKDAEGLRQIAEALRKTGDTIRARECEELASSFESSNKPSANKQTRPTNTGPGPYVGSKKPAVTKNQKSGQSGWKSEMSKAQEYLNKNNRSKAYSHIYQAQKIAERMKDWSGLLAVGDAYAKLGNKTKASRAYFKAKKTAVDTKNVQVLKTLIGKFRSIGNSAAASDCERAIVKLK